MVKAQLSALAELENNIQYLQAGESKLRGERHELKTKTEQSVAQLRNATVAQLDLRINELTKKIDSKKQKLLELDNILNKLNPAIHIDVARLKIEIDVATQGLEYLRDLRAIGNQTDTLKKLDESCENIRLQHMREWRAYQNIDNQLTILNKSASFQSNWNPLSDEYLARQALENQRNYHALNTQNLNSQREQCLNNRASVQRRLKEIIEKVPVFILKNQATEAALATLNEYIKSIQEIADKHWLKPILIDPLKQIFPIALGILAGAILVPFAIKLCLYFILAPLATEQKPICLQPSFDVRNQTEFTNCKSNVSISVDVEPDSELIVKPPYFHSAPKLCITSSKNVLNKRFVMTSLAAGMYNLTAVRADKLFSATLSSGQDTLAELLQFDVGQGQAVCLRPSNLVGVIQKRSCPVRISSHWRLGSLQAWLTFQLRYLVFHGPASIVVKGCRGVRIESADDSKAIEQASTLGFSAHLNYSTIRVETVMTYLTGFKGLLRDSFEGQSGFFLFEEMPDPGKRSGISGKGIEGAVDAVLKLFGI